MKRRGRIKTSNFISKKQTLIFLFILITITIFSAEVSAKEIKSSDYSDTTICSGCHPEIYKQWQGSMHSNSEKDPFYKAVFLLASKETNGLVDDFCPRCHAPVGLVAGEIPPADGSNLSYIAKQGLICDFCHTIKGYYSESNGEYITSPGMTKYGSLKDAISPYHESEYSELYTTSEYCGSCHDIDHPVSGMPIETTYKEWKEGPYSKAGIQCQDCHMRQKPGIPSTGSTQRPDNPGQACNIGPERDNVFTHYFVGANAFITDKLGATEHRDMAIERLQNAATIDIETPNMVKPGGEITVNILVTNDGAGHKIPTGIADEREVWIEITATDAEDQVIYRSGYLGSEGNIEPDAVIYQTVFGDADGKPTHKFWKATQVLSDYRIPPRETLIEEFKFKIPKDAKGPIQINARLNYRSAPQEIIDMLFGKGEMEVPIVVMTKKESIVELESGRGFSSIIIFTLISLVALVVAIKLKPRKKG